MHVAIECHACFEWLLPVMNQFRRAWPEVDIDIRPGLAFDALPALRREEVDLVVSSDPEEIPGLAFTPLFDYEPVLVVAADHPLATKPAIAPQDLATETLIAYPVDRARLDAFTEWLAPAGVEPKAVRPVELTAMILLLVASGRGVAVLPDWVVRSAARADMELVTRPLTRDGAPILKRLYGATRSDEATLPFVAHLIRLARQEAVKLQRDRAA
jgi:LysR family transcriptional regulator for metE and metH